MFVEQGSVDSLSKSYLYPVIFVSGGTGLLGAHLLFRLSADRHDIRASYRNETRIERVRKLFRFYDPVGGNERFETIQWVKGNILDLPFLEEAMQGCSEVYHCAALVSFHRRDFNRLMQINRTGTFNMVNVALAFGVEKFCHVSSTAAFSGTSSIMITEKDEWKNAPDTSGYSISKYSAEKEVWRAAEEGLNVVIVNPCVILGAGSWEESSLTLFKTLQRGLRHYPPGSNATVDARDVATIMVRLMNEGHFHERFLCIGSNQSLKELMECVAEEMHLRPPTVPTKKITVLFVRRLLDLVSFFTGKRHSMTRETIDNLFAHRSYDASKVKNTLNFEFTPLAESVRNAIKGRLD